MDADPPFADWMARVRAGDATAAADLVRRHERAVRVAVRLKLTDPRLRRNFDSMDVCQSVLASFFVRAAAGQYELDSPGQLVALLVKMARNKLTSQTRRHHQQQRDVGRVAAPADDPPSVEGAGASPSQAAEARELLALLLDRLTPDERVIARLRGDGYSWPEIGEKLGEAANTVRVRFTRALDRVSPDLGLADADG